MSKISPVTGHYVDVDVDGLLYKVFYLENGQGQPLVCQHTAGCHNHQWRGLLEDEEITRDYRVIAYDLPRHGKSDPPENAQWWTEEYQLSADHFANFIVALVDALELENPIFMGSSFGGNIALQLALRRPDRFAGVIPVEGADYSPGFYLDWWQHPHANAAQVCASGVWDLMAPSHPTPIAGRRGSTTARARRHSKATCTSTPSTTTSATSWPTSTVTNARWSC